MERTQRERTPEFLAGLDDPAFVARFLAGGGPDVVSEPVARGRLGSTTHISALDRDGWACAVTCSNGSASGVIVPGTGVHLNNMLGEQDLNPLGFHRHPPGRRMPSMMAPTVVLRDGVTELAVGSAGSNRIRSAILQTIIRAIDDGLPAQEAVEAPRVHWEDGIVYAEPGIDAAVLAAEGRNMAPFRERNLFFGGVQAAARGPRRHLLGRRRPPARRRRDRRDASERAVRAAGRRRGTAVGALLACVAMAGCGLDVQAPDLFLLTRTGQGSKLTLIVNDSGTIRCNGAKAKAISDAAADPGPRPGRQPGHRRGAGAVAAPTPRERVLATG